MSSNHSTDQNAEPPRGIERCKAGCGFFGNPQTSGLCSKCYSETHSPSSTTPTPSASNSLSRPSASNAAASTHSPERRSSFEQFVFDQLAESGDAFMPPTGPDRPSFSSVIVEEEEQIEEQPSRPIQKNVKRCFECNKKHGVLGFKCKCGYVYCDQHRHSTQHNCDFDFKEVIKDRIAALHSHVAPQKLEKF